MISLRLRLLLVSFVVLLCFVLVTGFALQRANLESALQAQQERMQGLVYALLGAVEIEGDQFQLNEFEVPEPRLVTPGSGLVAIAIDQRGQVVWQSTSALGGNVVLLTMQPGERQFIDDSESGNLFRFLFGFRWLSEEEEHQYTLSASESAEAFRKNQSAYQRQLWLWLLIPAALLLLVQLLILAWALGPLNRMAREIGEIEAGEDDQISGRFPQELHSLQGALNALLRQEGARQKKYRQSLDDLAHSLKTPLSVITSIVERKDGVAGSADDIAEQSRRMEQIISRQLKRASRNNNSLLSARISIAPVAEAVLRSLQKVYLEKSLEFESSLDDDCMARIDESDLFEMLGNLLDNACKWAVSQVSVSVQCEDRKAVLVIEDDGPGFPRNWQHLIERGISEDTLQKGQGLGLAMCMEIVQSVGGTLEIVQSSNSGAKIEIRLPV